MIEHFPNFLRAVISATANVMLMATVLQPKYSKKVTMLIMLGILSIDLVTAAYCYLSSNLTMLAKIDVILVAVLCFVVRPAFKDNIMQWLFSYMTVQNINFSVVVLSFVGSRRLPYPMYANSILRFILSGAFLIILSRYVRPLYRRAVEHWTAYLAVALSIYIAFNYYFLFSEDIILTLTEQAVTLLLLIFVGLSAYSSIFLSIKNLHREYQVKEENQKMQAEREYLQLATVNMSERLKLMEDVSAQNSRAAHDSRHFNNILLEFLEKGENHEAISILKKQNQTIPKNNKVYCENPVVNASVCHYAKIAEQSGILTKIELDIPSTLKVDSLELSMVVSNLMENAIKACVKQIGNKHLYINFICRNVGRLLLEMENPCAVYPPFDENGYPITLEEGHGVGSKSVIAFAKHYDGELIYSTENGVFRVRMLV